MIRTNQSENKVVETNGGKRNFACWNEDPQAQALRVEMESGNFFIFPFSHLLFAELTKPKGGDSLKLVFSTHEVSISGRHLREIGIAIQKQSVDWIKELPARYGSLSENQSAFIEQIEVTEIEDNNLPSVE